MADNGGHHQAAASTGGDHAEALEKNEAGANEGGIPAQDATQDVGSGSQAVAVAAEYLATGDVDAGSLLPPALRHVSEEVLYEVLVLVLLRMSAAEVARFSAVSRRLHDLISTDAFRRDHHRHPFRQPMPLFFHRLDHEEVPLELENPDLIRVHLRSVDIAARESLPVIRFAHADPALPVIDSTVFRIQGSCDGILLLSYHTRLYACNPSTRRWGRLPPLHVDHDIIGFYGHGPSNEREYRVLYRQELEEHDCRYWIFSLSFPDQPARDIGRPANLEAVRLVLADGILPSYEMPPVTIEHRLHWRAHAANCNVLVFDTVDEDFRWILAPRVLEGTRWVEVDGDQLLEIKGMLAMTLISQTLVDVWVLQEGEVWTHQFLILLPVAQLNIYRGYDDEDFVSATVFAVSQERNVLVQCPHVMLQCDSGGNVLKFYSLANHFTVLSRYMLQESLLMHAFLPMQQDDANDGDPPFFQGL